MEVFNLLFVRVIALHSEISTLNFQNNWNLPDWRNAYQEFLWPVVSKSSVHFRRPYPETPDNPENYIFFDYRGFPVPADENKHRIWILHARNAYI